MILRWFHSHTRAAVTATSILAIAAVLTTIAVVSDGYRAKRLDLGDASVWVTNDSKQLLGRANTAIARLNSAVPASSGSLDVAQSGATVLLIDKGNNSVDIVDPATAAVRGSVALPPQDPQLQLAGDRVSILSGGTGKTWVLPTQQLGEFSPSWQPTLDLGVRALTSMDDRGAMFAFSPTARTMYRMDSPDAGSSVSEPVNATTKVAIRPNSRPDALTSVHGSWALLDSAARKLYLDGRSVDLARVLPASTPIVLQRPSTDGDTVYLASEGALIGVPLHGGAAFRVTDLNRSDRETDLGRPAAPVQLNGCLYAAWSHGSVWRGCTDTPRGEIAMPKNAELNFRVNGSHVVLNDASTGAAWAIQNDNAVIDNWDELLPKKSDVKHLETSTDDTAPEFEKSQVAPVAIADEFGARPGRANTLPVLLNDFDPNGDPLMIDSVTAIPESAGRLTLINNDQQVQLSLPPQSAGMPATVAFEYVVSDGRGGSASASVVVSIRGPDQNSPPQQVRSSGISVASGGHATTHVLEDWFDPDADPFYLTGASTAMPDSVTSTPEGTITYADAGAGGTSKTIVLVASDGRGNTSGTLSVAVREPGTVPIIAEPFVVVAYAGHDLTISPLDHVHGGTDTLRLANVPDKPGTAITPDYEAGTFRFSSVVVGPHTLDYAVTDGNQTATGVVRVEVRQPPDASSKPITVPHTAFIHESSSKDIDVLATDIDPAGGVLLVTAVSDLPEQSGILVEVLQRRVLRVTLTRPLPGGSAQFHYQVSNGLAETQGTVTVIPVPQPSARQPPVAVPDSISVRVSDAIDIPVLANDTQPDGDDLTLDPKLARPLPTGNGLLFTSGNTLRYLAPASAGNFTAVYRVSAPDGQWATAEVKISVRERDVGTNRPPTPKTVVARAFAGDTVRVRIPLAGTDLDGDSVKLVGQETNPDKGAVTAVGPDWIDYKAGEYSTGTDTFQYQLVDALGANAVGNIRVGIAARTQEARNPTAVADEVTVRPGKTTLVQVLANDSDSDGSALSVTGVQPTMPNVDATATVSGSVISVHTGAMEGRYGFVYEIQNQRGGTASAFLTVVVAKDAPLARPSAKDTVLNLSDVLGRSSVQVDALANVFFADGGVRKLDLAVAPGYSSLAEVTMNKRLRVKVGDAAEIIPFRVSNPDDPSLSSYAFVWVPGRSDALPQLKRGAPRITVASGETVQIKLADHVLAAGGKKVRLTDASTVQATHANGANLVVADDTLAFTSANHYFGPASIAFQVTDGNSADDPEGNVATLVLPITVTPKHNQPPVVTGASIDFEPAQAKTVDLVKLTSYPYVKDQDQLKYTVLEPKPQGFAISVAGTQLKIRANENTPTGTKAQLLLAVADADGAGQPGRINLAVVPSSRPLAIPQPDAVIAARGTTTSIDVLTNDAATNPFPEVPLKVVAVRGADSASLPRGVTVTPSPDNSTLRVAVASDAEPVDANVQYEVADATGDANRYAWGSVRISVQDRPSPVTNLRITRTSDQQITAAWMPGAFNNAPISGFEATVTRADTGALVGTTVCLATSCTLATGGNGPDNSVLISVAARNAIGLSDPTAYPEAVFSNVVPGAARSVLSTPLDHGLRVTWNKPPDVPGASEITSYLVSVAGVSTTVTPRRGDPAGTAYSASLTSADIPNGSPAAIQVVSRNGFYGPEPTWNASTGTGTPAGPPVTAGAGPSVVVDGDGQGATLSWPALFDPNGQPIRAYYAAAFASGQKLPGCTVTGVAEGDPQLQLSPNGATFLKVDGAATAATFSDMTANRSYQFLVYAYNGQGCTSSPVVHVTPRQTPGTPTALGVTGPTDGGQGLFDFRLNSVTYSSGGHFASSVWNYQLIGDFPTEAGQLPGTGGMLAPGSPHYGSVVSLSVQVCETFDDDNTVCGGWSAPQRLGTAVSTVLGGLRYDRPTATFSWTSWPIGSYASVVYSCDAGATTAPMPVSGVATCHAPGSVLTDTLVVTVGANGTTYSRSYSSRDYD